MKVFLISMLLTCVSLTEVKAQEMAVTHPDSVNKNAISVYTGRLLGSVFSFNYERITGRASSISYLRTGSGCTNLTGTCELFLVAQVGVLSGAEKDHHFDFAAGPFIVLSEERIFPLSITAAYRYQKPDGDGFFRIGGGLMEGFQFSAGIRF